MGTELDRMTPAEIRWKHTHCGVAVSVLAELNACSQAVINKILAGENYNWSELNKPRRDYKQGTVVVNATEGRFYSSIRAAERQEGFGESTLAHRFSRDGPRIKINGQEFHLYRKELA